MARWPPAVSWRPGVSRPPPTALALSPRGMLQYKRMCARKLQSAFRRRKWSALLAAVGQGVGGCFAAGAMP